MYPLEYFAYERPYPTTDSVFVAMSFDHRLDARWSDVLQPAISSVEYEGRKLVPYRVDTRHVSDSILTDILKGVSSCRLVLADITSLNELDAAPIRNPNVMYELGLAHATRLAEEVLVFRSDSAKLLFDVTAVRVIAYDPDGNPAEARRLVAEALNGALQSVAQRKRQLIDQLVRRLDVYAWNVLLSAVRGKAGHKSKGTLENVVSMINESAAIRHLLEFGLIQVCQSTVTPELMEGDVPFTDIFKYEATALGREVADASFEHLGFMSLDTLKYMAEKFPGFKEQLRAVLGDPGQAENAIPVDHEQGGKSVLPSSDDQSTSSGNDGA